jgi:hypothetical protein
VLKGLNFYKDKQDPVAMADDEYPAWLWGVLDKGKGGAEAKGAGVDEGDLYGEYSTGVLNFFLPWVSGFGLRKEEGFFWIMEAGCDFWFRLSLRFHSCSAEREDERASSPAQETAGSDTRNWLRSQRDKTTN